jgi:hypothetical protein
MVFDNELQNDFELEELDEFQLFNNPKPECFPTVGYLILILDTFRKKSSHSFDHWRNRLCTCVYKWIWI